MVHLIPQCTGEIASEKQSGPNLCDGKIVLEMLQAEKAVLKGRQRLHDGDSNLASWTFGKLPMEAGPHFHYKRLSDCEACQGAIGVEVKEHESLVRPIMTGIIVCPGGDPCVIDEEQ